MTRGFTVSRKRKLRLTSSPGESLRREPTTRFVCAATNICLCLEYNVGMHVRAGRSCSLFAKSELLIGSIMICCMPLSGSAVDKEKICDLTKAKSVPGAAVALLEGPKVTYVTCGFRDANAMPVTTATVFEAASLSKPMFAFAVMHLVKQHRLNLDAPLSTYLPAGAMHESDPFHHTGTRSLVTDEVLRQVTPRTILRHTTGLPNWMDTQSLAFTAPQGNWQYSGEGYLLLQQAVEHITGMPLDVWMRQEILDPLGMRHSSYRWESRFSQDEAWVMMSRGDLFLQAALSTRSPPRHSTQPSRTTPLSSESPFPRRFHENFLERAK